MTNQWGRDSNFSSGGRRGGAGAVIAVLVALVLGAAGGFAASRFLTVDTVVVDEAVSSRTDELGVALATAQEELAAAREAQRSGTALVESLKADIDRMAAELDAMTEELAASKNTSVARSEADAAMDALKRERDGLAAENEAFKAGLEALEAERKALEQQAEADRQRLEGELERLQGDVPNQAAERDRLASEAETLRADLAALEERIKTQSDARAADAVRIGELETMLKSKEDELETARLEIDRLGSNIRDLMDAGRAEGPGAAPNQSTEPTDASDAVPALEPRPADVVAQALRTTPGLETLSEAERQQLTDRLVSGECVTTALEAVFERVPILTLRNLIRDLNSGC